MRKKRSKEKAAALVSPEKLKRSKAAKRRRLANGTYSMLIAGFVIAAVVLVNVIVQTIPSAFTTFDVTDEKLYSIGTASKEVLASLDEDVTLYFLTETGEEDEGVEKLLDNYEGNSSRIHVKKIDAVANPTFASEYSDDTVTLNSVIAVCGDRYKVADYSDFYIYSYSYYYSATGYDAEGKITSAIAFVTQNETVRIGYTVGHEELDLGTELTDALDKSNIETEEINLLTSDIPDDIRALIIFAPGADFTEEEAKKVREYLGSGGNALIVSMASMVNGTETPNFDSIMESYGVTKAEGIVMEGDTGCYVQAPYLLVPNTSSVSEVTAGLENSNIVYSLAEALIPSEDEDLAWTVTPILTTSENAYLKTDLTNTVLREDGDETGQFVLAAAIEQTFSNDSDGASDIEDGNAESGASEAAADAGEEADDGSSEPTVTKILYYTSPCAFNSDALSSLIQQSTALPEGNSSLISASIRYLTDHETAVSVPQKSLSVPQTTIDTGTVNTLGAVFMYVLPAAVLVLGFAVWMRRRKK